MSRGGCRTASATSSALDQELDRVRLDQPVVQAALGSHVGPLQVHRRQPRVVPRQAVAATHAFEQAELGQPLDLAGARRRVRAQPVEHRAPAGEHVGGLRVGLVAGVRQGREDRVEVLALHLQSGQPATVRELQPRGEGHVVADHVDGVHRVAQRQAVDRRQRSPGPALGDRALDEPEDQRRGAQPQVRGDLEHRRVADDHVQPTPPVRVGVRLVARVDDRAAQRGLQADLRLHVVGALRQLEARLLAALAQPDPAGAGEHLAGDEERDQPRGQVVERDGPVARGSSRACRRWRPCRPRCSCRAPRPAAPPSTRAPARTRASRARRRGPSGRRRAGW